jgi:DNA-binding winged helix-turn-helix (wHTH) protein
MEFEVLDFLVRHPGRAHSRHDLLRLVWSGRGDASLPATQRAVDVVVARLRRKLGPAHRHTIETVRKIGYRYTPQHTPRSTSVPVFVNRPRAPEAARPEDPLRRKGRDSSPYSA